MDFSRSSIVDLESARALVPPEERHLHVQKVLRVAEREFDLALASVGNYVLLARPPRLVVLVVDAIPGKRRQATIVSAADVAAVASGTRVEGTAGDVDGGLGSDLYLTLRKVGSNSENICFCWYLPIPTNVCVCQVFVSRALLVPSATSLPPSLPPIRNSDPSFTCSRHFSLYPSPS